MSTSTTTSRLDSDTVLDAGLALIRRHGVSGLTMRALADELGVALSGAYHHVSGKSVLLARATEAVLASIPLPDDGPPTAPWADRLRALALSFRAVLAEHPGLAPYVSRHLADLPAGSRAMRAAAALVQEAGLDDADARRAAGSIGTLVVGSLGADDVAAPSRSGAGRPPANDQRYRRPLGDDDFAFGLDLIIAGIQVRARSLGW